MVAVESLEVDTTPGTGGTAGEDRALRIVDDRFTIRRVGPDSPPSLCVWLTPDPAVPEHPLAGHEVWHAVTDTLVLLGPRPTAIAGLLLDHLDDGALNPLRLRMTAAEAASSADSVIGTISAVATLACWPARRRAGLVRAIEQAAVQALEDLPVDGSGAATRALRWVVKLSEDFPEDPLVLAPVLLRLRRFEAGTTYLLPPETPFAHLSGVAVGVSAAGSVRICGGLDPRAVDEATFVTAVSTRQPEPHPEPDDATVAKVARHAAGLSRPPV